MQIYNLGFHTAKGIDIALKGTDAALRGLDEAVKEIEVAEGTNLMEAINAAGFELDFPCGGRGTCGKCRVKITDGVAKGTPTEEGLLKAEELEQGIRLACQTKVTGNMSVELVNHKKPQHNILMASEERTYQIEPHLNKVSLQVGKPSLEDQRSDWARVKAAIIEAYGSFDPQPPLDLLRHLPGILRKTTGRVTVVMQGQRILGLEEQDTTGTMLGMAFDIGTTTIVGYLLDLYTGKELAVVSTLNPQTKFGADVISRVNFAGQDEKNLASLHAAVIGAINNLIGEAAEKAMVDRDAIYGVTIAANTCMHHLFLGINPKNIAISPYVAAVSEPVITKAEELGIGINEAGMTFVLPNIAGFVGADTTAVLLAAELDHSDKVKLIIDIGTNGEIALGSREKIVACSAAAGPAFEGAQISSGMRGAIGAIDHVNFGDKLDYSVIGGVSPLGLCGSALLDVVAGLLELGIIDKRGRLLPPEKITNPGAGAFKDNLVQNEGQAAFLLADARDSGQGRPIMVTQSDIRELQLAKGAMAAGIKVLMDTLGITLEEIDEVLLAGAFGNYLNPHSACAIGLIPQELEGKITMIGNAAGTGAKVSLLSASEYKRTAEIARNTKFVELGSYPGFNSIFGACMYFRQSQ